VGVPIDYAFRMLTEEMAAWWPASHHIGKVPFAEIIVEPRVGGKWMERGANGEECQWGTILAWDPPKQVVISWQLQADWSFSPDMSRASEVVFTFFAEGPEATRMEFEHRHIERHGEGWEAIRKGVEGGWTGILIEFERAMVDPGVSPTLTQTERDFAAMDMDSSLEKLLECVKNFTLAQWTFKPAADRWSAAENAEHVAFVEDRVLRRITEKSLLEPADPEKRKTLRYRDMKVMELGFSREPNLQAPDYVQPTARWAVPDELLQNLRAARARSKEFVCTTQAGLRTHYLDHPFFGMLDDYQWLLLVSAHMQRHTLQIEEIKKHPGFPRP
jgi:uncharacterized protein YndB with AHSA1/START domain